MLRFGKIHQTPCPQPATSPVAKAMSVVGEMGPCHVVLGDSESRRKRGQTVTVSTVLRQGSTPLCPQQGDTNSVFVFLFKTDKQSRSILRFGCRGLPQSPCIQRLGLQQNVVGTLKDRA